MIGGGKLAMKLKPWWAALLLAAATIAFAGSAGAVDGTIEINQPKVLANGGFPYVISTANTSYRLTGSLTVPASTNGINVTANNVTIDMNGFSITGPGSTSGVVNGVSASGIADVTVENGTITGLGLAIVLGTSGIVRNVHADANGFGIYVGDNSVVEGCTANNSTTTYGIACSSGCSISGNTANGNANEGIFCSVSGCQITGNTANGNIGVGINCASGACVISGNTVLGNPTLGIGCFGSGCLISSNSVANGALGIEASDTTTGYSNNVLKNTANFSSGKSLGNNLCNGTVC
jgi:parallel beta-helix repeat protein